MADAVSNAKGHTDKTIWLNLFFVQALAASAAQATVEYSAWTQDDDTEAFIGLKRAASNALGRNAIKLAGDATLLTAIIQAADTELNA